MPFSLQSLHPHHQLAIQAVDDINTKLMAVDDTCCHLTVELVTCDGMGRFFIRYGYLKLFDSIDDRFEFDAEGGLEQFLWDELADHADRWKRLASVIRKNETQTKRPGMRVTLAEGLQPE